MSVDLSKERRVNEHAFYTSLEKLSHYNNVSTAIMESLFNKNLNALVVSSGFNSQGEFCMDLVNLLNLEERFNYNLGKMSATAAAHYDIGTIVTFEWDKMISATPQICLKYNEYETAGIDNLVYLLTSYDAIAQALDTESSFELVYNAMALVTDALDNMYYNLVFNNNEYMNHLQYLIKKLVRFETMGEGADAVEYMTTCKDTLEFVASGLVGNNLENITFSSEYTYIELLPMKYHCEFYGTNFTDLVDSTLDSKGYRLNCVNKGLSDREKQARFKARLEYTNKSNIFNRLSVDGDVLSYLVLADSETNGENFIHLLCLDSFSRDFIVKRENIENGWSLRIGSIFNGTLDVGENVRIKNVGSLTSNSAEDRLNNITQLKKAIDEQKKIKALSAADKIDIAEQQDYLMFALKQYCGELNFSPDLKNKWLQMKVVSEKKKSSLQEKIYKEVIEKVQSKQELSSNMEYIGR